MVGLFAAIVLTAPGRPRGHVVALAVHISLVCVLLVGLCLVALLGDRKALGADVRELAHLDDTDRAWLRSLAASRGGLRREHLPEVRWGKYNTGQKLAAWGLFLVVGAIVLTGVGDAVLGHKTVHPILIPLLYVLLAGHVAMAVVNPATRPSLRGMVCGTVDRAWAVRHHPLWVEQEEGASKPSS
jgi:formate dehydrogenase subunit gamma